MINKHQELPLRNGVGIAVLNKENKIFVAKRIDNPADFWQMPQGGIDAVSYTHLTLPTIYSV